jgi:xanthine dehydrogenase YagT iron-sulfur-binding subunit
MIASRVRMKERVVNSEKADELQDGTEQLKEGMPRRTFLQGAGLGVTAVGAGLLTSEAAAEPLTGDGNLAAGPGPAPIILIVNGKTHKLQLEPRVTLVDALRNSLDYTGAKKVCDRATCGSCTVILDGAPVYGCTVLAIEAQGRDIQTIEGLSTSDNPHPLQKSFVEHDALQCGFCTPGFVMACKAFLDKNRYPMAEQVQSELGGNICRCGTYPGIRQAALDAARKLS